MEAAAQNLVEEEDTMPIPEFRDSPESTLPKCAVEKSQRIANQTKKPRNKSPATTQRIQRLMIATDIWVNTVPSSTSNEEPYRDDQTVTQSSFPPPPLI